MYKNNKEAKQGNFRLFFPRPFSFCCCPLNKTVSLTTKITKSQSI